MRAISIKALWLLVITTLLAFSFSSYATSQDAVNYAIRYSDDGDATTLVCGENTSLVGILSWSGLKPVSPSGESGGCSEYKIATDILGYGEIPFVFKTGGLFVIKNVIREKPMANSFWSDYEKILIFLGGLLAASLAKAFSVFFEPLIHLIKHRIRFHQTKKYLSLKASSFVKDVELSDKIRGVARGEYSSNFLISAKFRQRHNDLCIYFDEWRAGNQSAEEFRQKIEKL